MPRRTPVLLPAVAILLMAGLAAGCGGDEAASVRSPNNNNTSNGADAGLTPPSDASVSMDAGTVLPASDAGASFDASAPVDLCNPVEQTGCANAGDKCVVEGPAAGTECVPPSSADLALGATCQGQDCAAGLACARATATSSVSTCVKVCDLTSGDGCEPLGADYECRTRLTGTNWGSCGALPPVCDPYTQNPCGRDEACQPFLRRAGTWEFRCRLAGPGVEGVACGPGSDASCARGLACVSSPSGAAFCRRICQVNTDCANVAQCNGAVSEPAFMYCNE